MTTIIGDITMSLDGFVTGPGADVEHGLGLDAEGLHAWALDSDDPVDRGVLERHAAASGAVVMGRHLFDTVDVRADGATSSGTARTWTPARPSSSSPAPHPTTSDWPSPTTSPSSSTALPPPCDRRARPPVTGTCS